MAFIKLKPQDLRLKCEPSQFEFETTDELPAWDGVIGQERALRALELGLGIKDSGYNIFACGVPGTGKATIIRSRLEKIAEKEPIPDDWCYVYNFSAPDIPKAINLKAGMGRRFQTDMEDLIAYLKDTLPKVFESKEYNEEKSRLIEGTNKAKEALFEELVNRGQELGFQIKAGKTGITITPLYKGRPIEKEEVERLDPEELRTIEEKEKIIHSEIRDFLAKARILDKESEDKIDELNRRSVNFAIEGRIKELKERYSEYKRVIEYIEEVHEDILRNFRDFIPAEGPQFLIPFAEEMGERAIQRYRVNLLVDNSKGKGAPVIEETHPTYPNLIGRIEKKARFGTLQTDFTMIKAGSILLANGGYLILNVLDVLRSPFVWDALKRVIKKKEVKVEDVAELYGFVTTTGMKPEPIPVDLKIILIGNPLLYSLLQFYEEDFSKLFKVKADFDTRVANTTEGALQYANFIARLCREEDLLPLHREAVSAVIEYSSRLVDHKGKLSLRFSEIVNLIQEANFWATKEGRKAIEREDIEKALEEKVFRSNLIEEKIQEAIEEGTILVDTEGEKVGQVNGLSVHFLGDYMFGRPSRITARTFIGRKGIINIEREADLSGKTHNKGVLILSGYLGGHYAQDQPLSLSASLAFEQSYSGIDGDSASAAELAAIISSLAEVPIKQNLAVTGSINQHGEIQPIGGVNEKIEGFFMTCKKKGLTGDQGVIIPESNLKNLALKDEVVKAVEEGRFHIYAVKDIDDVIELLTGRPAGKRLKDGRFPKDMVNHLVYERLKKMNKLLKKESEKGKAGEEQNN